MVPGNTSATFREVDAPAGVVRNRPINSTTAENALFMHPSGPGRYD
jgi:hypothetical protein